MKGFRSTTILMLLLSVALISSSQTISFAEHFKMPKVAPPAPDAAAIEKFGNFPVSYATGVPDISIPIWTIKCGPLSWPITLSYHAGGIKVDESASMAGLGWSVNGIGAITRSRMGLPDEDVTGEPTYGSVTDANWEYLYSVQIGVNDSELDVFSFNFNGRGGKFVIHQNGTIVQTPQSNLKIVAATGLTSFTITDEEGIVYSFNQRELSQVHTEGQTSQNTYNTWFLRRVDLPNTKDSIVFNFTGAGTTSETYRSFTQAVGEKYIPVSQMPPVLSDQNSGVTQNNAGSSVNALKVTSITFPNGSLTFNYDANFREDIGTGTNVSNKLSSIAINESVNGGSSELKRFVFYQSYFFYKPPSEALNSPKQKRLRLDSLAETGIPTEPTPKKYKFTYNSTPLVPRENFGQDVWGFSNGIHGNLSLLQSQNVSFHNGQRTLTYSIGNANRSTDVNQMGGWMLSSITYPTGGKTEFVFEPHRYNADQTLTEEEARSASTNGAASPQQTISTFVYPGAPNGSRLIVEMSNLSFGAPSQPSVVSLKDLTTGTPIYVLSHPNPTQNYAIDLPFDLVQGHNYELKANTYATTASNQLTATIRVKWIAQTTSPDVRLGGGMRIKEMIHYTNASTIATKDIYVYDTAVTLTPFNLVERTYSEIFYRYGESTGGISCNYYYSPICRVYHSNSVYPVSAALGSPMLYRRVQKINVNASTGAVNGKSEYVYDVTRDEVIPVGGRYYLVPLLSNDWKNGFLRSETHYKHDGTNYQVIKKTENGYREYNPGSATSLRVQSKWVRENCSTLSQAAVNNDLMYYPYTTITGSKRLIVKKDTDYDDNQQVLSVTTTHYYNSDKYDYPTSTVSIDSKGNIDSVVTKRAPDFAVSGNVYNKMELKNMLSEIVEQKSYTGTTQLQTIKNNYLDWNNDQKVMSVQTVEASTMSNPLESRLTYSAYDSYDNPVSVAKTSDVVTTYLYAFNSKMPIAEVINATAAHIAYTSFETDEKGGWTGTFGAGRVVNGSLTGKLSWTQNSFNFSKTGLSTTTTYTVSYWSKNGSYSVNSTTPVTGRGVNGWTHYSHKVVNPASGTITVTGSGTIDELRLHPALNSQMATYTYRPQVGVTSKCDANNRITYYEYDELQRLILIRDQDRNIIKKFAYNYNGQTEYPNIYYNTVQNTVRIKQGCTSCQIGSSVTYTVPADTYLSTFSQAAANALATADGTANAQAYANAVGTCNAPVSSVMTGNNQITNNAFSVKFHNDCTGTDYTYTLNANANITFSPAIPTGNYTVTITKMFGPGSYTFRVNGQLQFTSSDPVFSNVTILASGNQGVIIQL